jgi:choline-glycine betaine transporter
MDTDLALVIGIVIAALTIPSILSAVSDRRAPRASAITILIAGGLIVFAITAKPGGYSLEQVPDVVLNVVARFIP